MDSYEIRIGQALGAPAPRPGFFDELLVALREMWELPAVPEAEQPPGSHVIWIAGSVAAGVASVAGAAGAWYGLRKRQRRRGVA
jgi:hypothetical protein